MRNYRSIAGVALLLALAACSDDRAADSCDVGADRNCTPAYEPTFDNLFQKTFKVSCALSGTSCHAAAGAKAGLVFEDATAAYGLLQRRVVGGKPECSLLARRVLSTDTSYMMPPGLALPPGEQCAIVQWIAKGAPR